jgi:Peptidase family S51
VRAGRLRVADVLPPSPGRQTAVRPNPEFSCASYDRGAGMARVPRGAGGGDATYLCYWMRQSGLAGLLPSLRAVWVGLSGGSMVMTPSIGAAFVSWGRADSDKALGVVDFAIFPHLDHERLPENSMADAEKWAASMPVPATRLTITLPSR